MSEVLKQRVAAKVVIEAEGGILVLHPSAIDLNRNWQIPGGIRDDISESLAMTGVREVREETGITLETPPNQVIKYGEWQAVDKGEKVKILAVFFHVSLDKRPDIVLSEEHDDYMWLDSKNYRQITANPEVYELVELLKI